MHHRLEVAKQMKIAVAMGGLVLLSGCGGSLAKTVNNTVIVQRENGSNVELILTRNNSEPDSADRCTLESARDWCTLGVSEVRFVLNPSQTLYRAYIRNNGDASTLVTTKVERDDGRSGRTSVRVDPGQTIWVFELGVETVKVKAGI
jgi:hypothetical protein